MNGYIRFSDYKDLFKPTGPLFAFIVPWLLVITGQLLQLCNIIKPVYSSFYLVVIGNILTFIIIAFVLQTFAPQYLSGQKKELGDIEFSSRFQSLIYILLTVYLACELFQVILFQGFPLAWLLLKMQKTYFDFGVSSLNGLLNAVYLFATTGFYLIFLKRRSSSKLLLLLFLFSIPILLVSRQLLVSLFLQISCCSIIYSPKNIKKFVKYGIALFIIFIVVGNFRTGINTLINILQPKSYIPEFLYPLLWIYAYVVTPFNNVNANIDSITPLGMPYNELTSLVPSFLRNSLEFDASGTGFSLVHSNMTVSTFYIEPLLDFGRIYAFLFMTAFQLLFILSYRRALRSKTMIHIIEYSILYMISILSIFSNHLLYLPVVFQLVIINLAKIQFFKKFNRWVFAVKSEV